MMPLRKPHDRILKGGLIMGVSSRRPVGLKCLVLLALLYLPGVTRLAAQDANDHYVLPPSIVQEYINKDKNLASLEHLSPDGDHFLITSTTELSSLQLMS